MLSTFIFFTLLISRHASSQHRIQRLANTPTYCFVLKSYTTLLVNLSIDVQLLICFWLLNCNRNWLIIDRLNDQQIRKMWLCYILWHWKLYCDPMYLLLFPVRRLATNPKIHQHHLLDTMHNNLIFLPFRSNRSIVRVLIWSFKMCGVSISKQHSRHVSSTVNVNWINRMDWVPCLHTYMLYAVAWPHTYIINDAAANVNLNL